MNGNTRGGGHSEALRNYNLGKTFGIGTFGKVKIAEHKLTGHRVAIKIINRRQMRNMEMEEKGMLPFTDRPPYFINIFGKEHFQFVSSDIAFELIILGPGNASGYTAKANA